jgi:hypothetical protein
VNSSWVACVEFGTGLPLLFTKIKSEGAFTLGFS